MTVTQLPTPAHDGGSAHPENVRCNDFNVDATMQEIQADWFAHYDEFAPVIRAARQEELTRFEVEAFLLRVVEDARLELEFWSQQATCDENRVSDEDLDAVLQFLSAENTLARNDINWALL